MTRAVTLVCESCGYEAPSLLERPLPLVCPHAEGDPGDHVLAPRIDASIVAWPAGNEASPFVRYRRLLFVHQAALELGLGDEGYLDSVRLLDDEIERVDGRGFRVSPAVHAGALDRAVGASVLVKDETGNVSGSHKARHLFGIAILLDVVRRAGLERAPRHLSIASCGNAALAAAVVARAAGRHLDVHVPPDAEPSVMKRLGALGAIVHVDERVPGMLGDPTVAAFRAEVRAGAIPFGCQGPDDGVTLDGGRTLGFELADALREHGVVDRLFVQVGGGALASSVCRGLDEARRLGVVARVPRIHPVQSERVAPVRAAYERLVDLARARAGGIAIPEAGDELAEALRTGPLARFVDAVLAEAARDRAVLFRPWADPRPSVAHGILDDDTYDGLALLRHVVASGGTPVVVDEATFTEAAASLRTTTGIDADETGAAGLAGLLRWRRAHAGAAVERVLVLATGARR